MLDVSNWIDLQLENPLRWFAFVDRFLVFTLVLVRVSGLTAIGPLFGQSAVPTNVRILLVLSITYVITPMLDPEWNGVLQHQWRVGIEKLDVDENGRLSRDEVPDHLLERYDATLRSRSRDPDEGLFLAEMPSGVRFPSSVTDYARVAVGEFALGLVLGLGVFTVLQGLTLAGQLIDQQSGLALGEIVNPGLDAQGSVSGQFLYLFGVTVFLMLEPFGGHIIVVTSLVDTFQTLPPGEAFVGPGVVEYLSQLVHASLVLAIQVAAPVLAVMSLVALTMGFLGHTVPQINVLVIGFAIRATVALTVLTLCLSGTARLVIDSVPAVLRELVRRTTALP